MTLHGAQAHVDLADLERFAARNQSRTAGHFALIGGLICLAAALGFLGGSGSALIAADDPTPTPTRDVEAVTPSPTPVTLPTEAPLVVTVEVSVKFPDTPTPTAPPMPTVDSTPKPALDTCGHNHLGTDLCVAPRPTQTPKAPTPTPEYWTGIDPKPGTTYRVVPTSAVVPPVPGAVGVCWALTPHERTFTPWCWQPEGQGPRTLCVHPDTPVATVREAFRGQKIEDRPEFVSDIGWNCWFVE